jgi:hypothetical protein
MVIAKGVALRRLVELDREGGFSGMQVQDIGPVVVRDVVEYQVPDAAGGVEPTRAG